MKSYARPRDQANENPAYILSLLTSVGGVVGYARTGSVPSIVAGLTVGALVSQNSSHGRKDEAEAEAVISMD